MLFYVLYLVNYLLTPGESRSNSHVNGIDGRTASSTGGVGDRPKT